MRLKFAITVLDSLKKTNDFAPTDTVVAVCAGLAEFELFKACAITQATLTGFDPSVTEAAVAPYAVVRADAMQLPFADKSFDYGFVSDGLHHCDSPHRALLELYRVCRKGVIVLESRDSLVQRIAERFYWTTQSYELPAVRGNGGTCGGVNYTCVPNHVYRWTEREFEKTLKSYDPTGPLRFRFFYGFNAPVRDFRGIRSLLFRLCVTGVALIAKLFPRQRNSFAMVAWRPKEAYPWLRKDKCGLWRFVDIPSA